MSPSTIGSVALRAAFRLSDSQLCFNFALRESLLFVKKKKGGTEIPPISVREDAWHLRAGYLFLAGGAGVGITPSAAAILKKWKGSVAVLYT